MIIYILKFSACLALFLVFYKFVLEKENMHVFKRFYLIGSVLLSIAIPLITFTYYVMPSGEVIPQIIQNTPIESNDLILEIPTNFLPIILWSIYGIGLLLFSVKFIKNLYDLSSKIKRNPKQKIKSITNVLLQDLVTPHTFFNYIFFNKQKYEANEIPQEVQWHEQSHAAQRHSIDIVFIEVIQLIFWFNPLIYVIKHIIKLNHEFLADQAVLNKGVKTTSYQQTLLAFSSNVPHPQLANAINYSLIKKRFTVMKTKTTKRGVWIRCLILLPVLALSLYSFSDKIVIEKEALKTTPMDLNSFDSEEKITITEDVNILINRKGQLLVNDNLVQFENLLKELEKYNREIPFEDRHLIKVKLTPDANTPMDIVSEVKKTINDYNVAKILINKLGTIISQEKATKNQIKEYNKLAKKYNDMPQDDMHIKNNEIKRLKYLYSIMSDDQKKDAEAFPNIPTPPAPPAPPTVTSIALISPPPPPLPPNATEAQKRKFKEVREMRSDEHRMRVKKEKLAHRESQTAARVLKLKAQKGELIKVREIQSVKLKKERMAQRESRVAAKVIKLKAQKIELIKVREIRSNEDRKRLKEVKLAHRESQVAAKVLKLKAQKGELVTVREIRLVEDRKRLKEVKLAHKESQVAAKVLKLKAQKEKRIQVREIRLVEDRKRLKEVKLAHRESQVAAKVLKLKAQKEKRILVREIPSPPTPKSPIEHIKDMTKKGATFIYKGKSISSEKALKLMRSNKNLNIMTNHTDNKNYVVTISKRPIVVED